MAWGLFLLPSQIDNIRPLVNRGLGEESGSMSEPAVMSRAENGIFVITLNRPAALNALDHDLMVGLRDAVFAAEHDHTVRCVVVRGGSHFMAGGDLKWFSAMIEGRSAAEKT